VSQQWPIAIRLNLARRPLSGSLDDNRWIYNEPQYTRLRGSLLTRWFVQQDSSRGDLGPFRPNELLDLVRSGEVSRETMLRKDDSTWFAAGDVGGLFEAALRPTIQYFCPQCKTEVDEPPVTCLNCGREIRQGITRITEHAIALRTDAGATSTGSVKRWLQKKGIRKSQDTDLS
jgi:hypothetical protein